MASWILTQQWLISGVLIILLLNEYKASTYLGGRVSYALWLLLPLCLIINNLPQELSINNNPKITSYLVSFNATTQAVSQAFSWQIVWGIGAIAILLTSLFATIKLHISCTLTHIDKADLPIALPNKLSVYQSDDIKSPMLLGILNPRLLLPNNYRSQFTKDQLKLVLEHEVCHFKRLDNLTNLVSVLLLSMCWFNPLAWVGYASFRRHQEIACDYVVLANKAVSQRIEYSKALVSCIDESQGRLTIYSNYYQRNTMFKRINILKNYIAAAKGEIEGSVVLRFDINPDGSVSNVVVVKSVPETVFDKEATRALNKWVYQKSESGSKGEMVQLDFIMDGSKNKIKNLIEGIEKINVVKH